MASTRLASTRRFSRRALLAIPLVALLIGAGPAPVAAADEVTLEARVLLEGHARVGAWLAIAIQVANSGPPIAGELRIAAGAQGRTRFGTIADLPTNSRKDFFLYAQPPQFGTSLEVVLVEGDRTVAQRKVAFTLHESTQLVVGVVAERPQAIVGSIDLAPGPNSVAPVVVTLDPSDLPVRVEGWAAIDRLVWQDVDSSALSDPQIAALVDWLAGGGRLVIAGGTGGPGILSAFPDTVLPYRPTATVDMAPESLAGLIGELPDGAGDLPALGGQLARGRALATSGDVVTAAEAAYGAGSVTLLGFDPSADWIADSGAAEALWQRLLPPRVGTTVVLGDDSQFLQALQYLPSLALPPIGGLIALLLGYIILIGPVNYLVLRRLDRREWAWFTMPALIVTFAVGSYGFGSALRGSDILVNEVAIIRGAPDATEGQAQVYVGVFSPSRSTYQLTVPGGALLSAPISSELFGSPDAGSALDVLQGDPARVRNLAVGFGTLRAIRAETAAAVPRVTAELELRDGRLVGTVRNLSDRVLEKPAVVLGSNIAMLSDLGPSESAELDLALDANPFGQSLADRIVGQVFFGDPGTASDQTHRLQIRHTVLTQLTWDPNFGPAPQLQAEGPVLLAWDSGEVLKIDLEGRSARRSGNILYYVPLGLRIVGATVFRNDLIRNSIVSLDAPLFSKGPQDLSFGAGSVTVAYRPIVFQGSLRATRLLVAMGFAGELNTLAPTPVDPTTIQVQCPSDAQGCADPAQPSPAPNPNFFDGLPNVEIFDRTGGRTWMSLGHLNQGGVFEIRDPGRFVDPGTGSVLVRFVNDRQDGVGFQFSIQIEGEVG